MKILMEKGVYLHASKLIKKESDKHIQCQNLPCFLCIAYSRHDFERGERKEINQREKVGHKKRNFTSDFLSNCNKCPIKRFH
jgi:hypothetical protein